jgi:hypothetical protein
MRSGSSAAQSFWLRDGRRAYPGSPVVNWSQIIFFLHFTLSVDGCVTLPIQSRYILKTCVISNIWRIGKL